jgi:single-stranded DNA-binding protein
MSGIEAAFFGTLGKNAESKVSASGKQYLRLSVRVGDGDQAQWVSVMAFDKDAIDAADKMTTGGRVYVEGRLSINEWTDKAGARRTGISLMSWHCRLSQIGRNRPKREQQQPKQNFPRDMHAPLGKGAADLNDDVPEWR